MFGKRSAAEDFPRIPPAVRAEPVVAKTAAPPLTELQQNGAAPKPQSSATVPPPPPKPARVPDQRSDSYYQIKTTIFNALIDTIDLAQLAQLDPDSAREEIRDIVNEIISIKA